VDIDVRTLADRIDALLPQTQCRGCGHEGCRPYAHAIANGAPLNRCAPGGDSTIAAIARLTGRQPVAIDLAFGSTAPLGRAFVDESACIGCTLCIDACPVDAIVGAAKRMHTVIAALCTGCALCVPPCPVDCISMVPAGRAWSAADATAARARFVVRNARQARRSLRMRAAVSHAIDAERARRQDAVARALARARARRAGHAGTPRT
jgi:electron transport complex protein RnfB